MKEVLLILAGGLIGFISSIGKEYFLEKNKRKYKEIELKREKAEELYLLLEKWANYFFSQKNHLTLVMEEHIDYNTYLDYVIEEGEKNQIDFKRIDMIINIYFSELVNFEKDIRVQMDVVNSMESKYKKEYINGNTDGREYIDSLLIETLKAINLINKLKTEVVLIVKNLN